MEPRWCRGSDDFVPNLDLICLFMVGVCVCVYVCVCVIVCVRREFVHVSAQLIVFVYLDCVLNFGEPGIANRSVDRPREREK